MFLTSPAAIGGRDADAIAAWQWPRASVLLISYDWHPEAGGAEALAGRRLVEALTAAGANVHALAGLPPGSDPVCEGGPVTWVPHAPLARSRLGHNVRMVRSTVPEATGGWVAPAVAAGRQLLSRLPRDTVIYGRAMPGTSNVVAWHLAHESRRPLVAHFSDEWPSVHVLPANRKLLAPHKWAMFAWWRRRLLRDAGALTFTNPLQGDDVLGRWYRQHAGKSFIVPHLRSSMAAPPPLLRRGPFHIVHTGNLYPPDHTSRTLLEGVRLFIDRVPESAAEVRFTQAGWSSGDLPIWTQRFDLGEVVRFVGRLGQPAVRNLIGAAHLLVAIDYARAGSTTLLSKIPDYLWAERPILAIASADSAMGRLFADEGAGLLAPHGAPEQVAHCLTQVYHAWRAGSVEGHLPSRRARESFSVSRTLDQLAAAFATAARRS